MTHPVLESLLRRCVLHDGGEPDAALIEASQAFVQAAHADPALLREAALAAESLPVRGAGFLAILVGGAIERGADAQPSFDPFWRILLACCEPEPVDARRAMLLDTGLRMLGRSLVSHLARLPQQRAALLDDAAFDRVKRLSAEQVGAFWVCEAIERGSADLLLLHAPSRRGWRARYENVAQCFHLFSLLQSAVGTTLPGGRQVDPALAAAARGETHGQVLHDQAWWHYQVAGPTTPDAMAMVPGDLLTRHLPAVDGAQVLVLWDPILAGRGWSSEFFGAHLMQLPASFELREPLSDDESSSWFKRLGFAEPAQASPPMPGSATRKRPWWRPF